MFGPMPTSRQEKLDMIDEIVNRLLARYASAIVAIGVYGSIALESDGPFSDIEMYVIVQDGAEVQGHEFVYEPFKIEVAVFQRTPFLNRARAVDDLWALTADSYINIKAVFDPDDFFLAVKSLPLDISDVTVEKIMREFVIWEPYETIAKLRNNYNAGNLNYISLGAKDLSWRTAKLIGLANKQYYSTRAKTFEESLLARSKPDGYAELVQHIMNGSLSDRDHTYKLCEQLWNGLNDWLKELGIEYVETELPF
ncbi:kanamycin nucleotidyltransferase C-terminal domain-containing protein [Alicyclobacillus sp. SO9]|uniref:kanamycin nucleotidyltransferase C-terminal domain-containing protein n=1 Tax=Alicyclobacillus sp. SO9 TaxID=2665646 RepID=UPI0018E7185D|nr:kanamycin nucleotidyltransferase C-terminal domain-containing protein [Alicyclobacillus sp. SO9]QQE80625.1 KNTase domain-containing protein [Alicyclobacillus sp. SO9]